MSKFEKIHTIRHYCDQPRSGIADFKGQLHFFEYTWDEAADDYGRDSILSPISAETLRLCLESKEIWQRWQTAVAEGRIIPKHPPEIYPSLPEDQARAEELRAILAERLKIDPLHNFKAFGELRYDRTHKMSGINAPWEVCWHVTAKD